MGELTPPARSALESIFKDYSDQMDAFLQADRLYRLLIANAHDGTEAYGLVDAELRSLEHRSAATKIKIALLERYRNTIRVSDAVEIVMTLLEKGELS
jgi:hypothetical protein